MTEKRLTPLIFPVLLVPILLVLLLGARQRDLRSDEAIAVEGTRGDVAATLLFESKDVEAPLYFVLTNLWQQFTGTDQLIFRVFSVFQSLITLALVYRLAQDWLGKPLRNRWMGAAAMVALGVSAYFFVYAIEIRPYALMMLTP